MRAFLQRPLLSGNRDNMVGQPTDLRQIAPCSRPLPGCGATVPQFSGIAARSVTGSLRTLDNFERRAPADQAAKFLPDMTEVLRGIEILDKLEDIALAVAFRVPPALAIVIDNNGLTVAAKFQVTGGTLRSGLPIQPEPGFLQHDGAVYGITKLIKFSLLCFWGRRVSHERHSFTNSMDCVSDRSGIYGEYLI
ncbi:hypothetical protein GLUCOINTEAF2_0204074 [Komagataeibacter intermedius AF2]|uniref:Uncharacterized protein n=1 Tax=Komagataeibacter intermedius AF2 TaxID=1458464 RepID=A0A0N0MFL6_9PROT|nr:hypothetical protein GLUCOINTEAF2_0204074 [Komagataeibacter intermedius AF2]